MKKIRSIKEDIRNEGKREEKRQQVREEKCKNWVESQFSLISY